MASYTSAQLYGAGAVGENLSGLKTFTFTNTGGSSYFILETVQDNNGTYTNTPQACANGVWSAPASTGFIQTPYMAAAVIQPGTTVITFTPSISITGTNYRLRGTGIFTLAIT